MKSHIPSRGELCSPASLKGKEKQSGAAGMSRMRIWRANAVRPYGCVEINRCGGNCFT